MVVEISHQHIGRCVRIIYGTIGTAISTTTEVEGILEILSTTQVVITTTTPPISLLIISMDVIDNFEVLEDSEEAVNTGGTLADLDELRLPSKENIQAMLKKNIRLATERESKLGVNVPKATQSLFDALSKTCTCAWRGANIVVFGDVIIEPPYTEVKDHPKVASGVVERVRLVLSKTRSRLEI